MARAAMDLARRKCVPCEGGVAALAQKELDALLKELDGWALQDQMIQKTYEFTDFHQAVAFVNALAWLSHRENHHPDLVVGYNSCCVKYRTHAIGGLSENDFICAAKADWLFDF